MKVYFPHLNTLRFFAALLVFVHHVEMYKKLFSLNNFFDNSTIQLMGKIGVTLFFVLSGFLITYLLIAEEKEHGFISIKAFYIRRIKRIWPLYFLLIILAFFVLPQISWMNLPGHNNEHFYTKLAFFVLMMPNVIHALGAGVAYATPAWSIGVEEQFYLIWPWLMRYVRNKMNIVLGVILFYLVVKYTLAWNTDVEFINQLNKIWNLFPIDNMAVGGFFAIAFHYHYSGIIAFVQNKWLQIAVWITTISLIISGKSLGFFHYQIYAVLFGLIIFNLALNKNSIVQFRSDIIEYLGRISYGIYMYHSITIVVCIKLLMHFAIFNQVLLYLLSLLMTIGVSALSYEFFEVKITGKRK
ncbi:MAG: acyltransferase [Bacteroidia bacterium]|nr:acyltransferase [Bacteroidia bacterium]MCZ2249479.1 acyltransferase [Bacteroidia bacterium]